MLHIRFIFLLIQIGLVCSKVEVEQQTKLVQGFPANHRGRPDTEILTQPSLRVVTLQLLSNLNSRNELLHKNFISETLISQMVQNLQLILPRIKMVFQCIKQS